ncbi:reverse transcriptase-like protein [Paeniglutamicibacter cryotolerans]|uniref:Putative phosphoglycerate mutase n=1 Tax=Paeniglutamicibacter cryotolerans TaxID=670079 RepID=A0A839QTP0_9MICC|nr:reverse transcriptase-like protein [Paeniglutamicibacter cryotolerans]MBB2997336.1 putative phosphoglycerate mutase [Paeniglutamicibacter cryotolerans]
MTLFDPLAAGGEQRPGPDGRREVIVYVGGGSRGNPGPAGYGVLLFDGHGGEQLSSEAKYLGNGSKNEADYQGLIAGLKLANSLDAECRIIIRMDSKLVIEQMSGNWKIVHASIRALAKQARLLTAPGRVSYQWIPCGSNTEVDALANQAIDDAVAGRAAESDPEPGTASIAKPSSGARPRAGAIHHVEIWVPDLEEATASMGWMFEELGFEAGETWATGRLWRGAEAYLVIESGPDIRGPIHERNLPGVNHLAFNAGSRANVDRLTAEAISHGWSLMFGDRHPFAGGSGHYAAYLENEAAFEVELVATED